MQHLSEWHAFNPRDRQTYPKEDAPVQVRYGSGKVSVGFSHDLFTTSGSLSDSLITAWRYIKAETLPGQY
jgi:hypothetical protein